MVTVPLNSCSHVHCPLRRRPLRTFWNVGGNQGVVWLLRLFVLVYMYATTTTRFCIWLLSLILLQISLCIFCPGAEFTEIETVAIIDVSFIYEPLWLVVMVSTMWVTQVLSVVCLWAHKISRDVLLLTARHGIFGTWQPRPFFFRMKAYALLNERHILLVRMLYM